MEEGLCCLILPKESSSFSLWMIYGSSSLSARGGRVYIEIGKNHHYFVNHTERSKKILRRPPRADKEKLLWIIHPEKLEDSLGRVKQERPSSKIYKCLKIKTVKNYRIIATMLTMIKKKSLKEGPSCAILCKNSSHFTSFKEILGVFPCPLERVVLKLFIIIVNIIVIVLASFNFKTLVNRGRGSLLFDSSQGILQFFWMNYS